MVDEISLEQDTELRPIPQHHESAAPLLLSPSKDIGKSSIGLQEHELQPKPGLLRRYGGERFEGWKFTIFLALVASVIVILFNMGFLIYAVVHAHGENKRVIYEGDYDKVHNISVGFHLIINILSTCLLSASNFGMQCLISPTRQDIDRAHKYGRWLDIGVPSVRNLFHVSKRRSVLWICLAFSSLPFHLVYNSAVYSTTAVIDYPIYAGPGSIAEKNWSEITLNTYDATYDPHSVQEPAVHTTEVDKNSETTSAFQDLFHAAKEGSLRNLSNTDCASAFIPTFQTKYRNLLLVTEDVPHHDEYVFLLWDLILSSRDLALRTRGPHDWMCWTRFDYPCSEGEIPAILERAATDNWTVSSRQLKGDDDSQPVYKVDYCLAELAPQHNRLQYSLAILIAAIAFNLVKTGILLYIWLSIKETPLLTVGDAIASFLRLPDAYSRGRTLLAYERGKNTHRTRLQVKKLSDTPKVFAGEKRLWAKAISGRRWAFSIFLWFASLSTTVSLLSLGLSGLAQRGIDFWNQPHDGVSSSTLIDARGWPNDFLSNVFIANTPQLVYSLLYFACNSLLTAMCLGAEWSAFAISRKGLRVSNNPIGSQRANYFLSVPYRFGIPMIGTSAVLHWLISLSLFTVAIEGYDTWSNRDTAYDLYHCGYSPIPIICALSIGSAMVFSLIALSLRRFKSGMPVVRSSSIDIAAACQPFYDPNHNRKATAYKHALKVEEDEDMALLPVQWGAIPVDGEIGHCSFTSRQVDPPEVGKMYL